MDFKLVFPCIVLFFLSWGFQGFSHKINVVKREDTLGKGLADVFQQIQQQTRAAASASAVSQSGAGVSDEDAMPCMEKLTPCQPFLHSSSPPATCCAPLKDLIAQQSQCVCKVFHNPQVLKTLNLTVDEALAIPKACGISVDTSVCKNAKAIPPSGSASQATPSTSSNHGSTNSNSSDSDKGSSNSSGSSNSNASVSVFGFIATILVVMFSALYI